MKKILYMSTLIFLIGCSDMRDERKLTREESKRISEFNQMVENEIKSKNISSELSNIKSFPLTNDVNEFIDGLLDMELNNVEQELLYKIDMIVYFNRVVVNKKYDFNLNNDPIHFIEVFMNETNGKSLNELDIIRQKMIIENFNYIMHIYNHPIKNDDLKKFVYDYINIIHNELNKDIILLNIELSNMIKNKNPNISFGNEMLIEIDKYKEGKTLYQLLNN